MSDEKKTVPAEQPTNRAAEPKRLTYKGPRPAPTISNVPGMVPTSMHADDITNPEHIKFIQASVPAAKDWWE